MTKPNKTCPTSKMQVAEVTKTEPRQISNSSRPELTKFQRNSSHQKQTYHATSEVWKTIKINYNIVDFTQKIKKYLFQVNIQTLPPNENLTLTTNVAVRQAKNFLKASPDSSLAVFTGKFKIPQINTTATQKNSKLITL